MAVVIVLNALTIGLSSDINKDWRGWIVVDSVFAAVFMFECVWHINFAGIYDYFTGKDRFWSLIEIILIVTSVVEIVMALGADASDDSDISLFRLCRLTRVSRVLRVFRVKVARDLVMMVDGCVGGMKTLLWSCVLISVPIYAAALLFRETLGSHKRCFADVPTSFFTMFRCVVVGDCSDADGRPIFVSVTQEHGWAFGASYCLITMFMFFGLFNVIVAIYVENMVAAAKYDDVNLQRQRLMDEELQAKKTGELIKLIWSVYDARDSDGVQLVQDAQEALAIQLTPHFFNELLEMPHFKEVLSDLDVPEEDQYDLFDTLDVDNSGSIDIRELIKGVHSMRGEARRSDIITIKLVVRDIQAQVQSLMRCPLSESGGQSP